MALSSNWLGGLPLTQRMGVRVSLGLQKDVRKGVVRNAPKYIKCGKSYPASSCDERWARNTEDENSRPQHNIFL